MNPEDRGRFLLAIEEVGRCRCLLHQLDRVMSAGPASCRRHFFPCRSLGCFNRRVVPSVVCSNAVRQRPQG
jgi:hypothetical protein